MLLRELLCCSSFKTKICPNNLIPEILFPKHLIHQHLHIMPDVPVEVYIDRTLFAQEFPHQYKARIDHLQIADSAVLPCVGISELLKHRGLLFNRRAGQGDLRPIIRLAVKRRVYINQVNLAAHGRQAGFRVASKQRLHHQQVVPIDKPVVPFLFSDLLQLSPE